MNNSEPKPQESTAVDDVRRVREAIAAEHGGDIRGHLEESDRIFNQLRSKLNLRVASPPKSNPQRDGTQG